MSLKINRKYALLLGVFIMLVALAFTAGFTASNNSVNAASVSWSGKTNVGGGMAQVTALIRPSDGAFFFIGENCCFNPNGGGSGNGGVYIRTNAGGNFNGNNFNNPIKVAPLPGETSHDAIFDRNSNLYVVWWDSARKIYLTKYDASGNKVIDTKVISGNVCGECSGPSITTSLFAAAPDELHVGFRVFAGSSVQHFVVSSTNGGANWSAPAAIDDPAPSSKAQNIKIMQAPNGNVYAVVYRFIAERDTLWFNRKLNSGNWDKGFLKALNNGGGAPWAAQFAISIDSSSNPYILFNGQGIGCSGTEAYWVLRSTDSGSSFSSPTNVSACSQIGRTPAIAGTVVADGSVWFSIQWSGSPGGQRFVHSSNGTSWEWGRIYDNGDSVSTSISWANNQILVGAKNAGGGTDYATAVGGGTLASIPAPPPPAPPPTPTLPASVDPNTDAAFYPLWARTDDPVLKGLASRSWIWGTKSTGFFTTRESYAGGQRLVQYHDKSRMEINNPNGNRSDLFFVTNGLLVREMISGNLQISDSQSEQRLPSGVPVSGDLDNNGVSPLYSSFRNIASLNNDHRVEDRTGQPINTALAKDGTTTTLDTPPATVKAAYYDNNLGHNIPDVFWNYMNSKGKVNVNGQYLDDQQLINWVFAFGYPISEAYWTRSVVAGVEKDVLVQMYERRVLTYTPTNPKDFQVEMGNVGQQYFKWRYGILPF
jgi:hypothetical protein